MKFCQKPRMLGTMIPLAGVLALSGCSYLERPGEVCSLQQTYDTIDKVIVSGAPADGAAKTALVASLRNNFSPEAYLKLIGAYVSFKMPTVDAVDKDTGKVSCNVLLTLTGPAEAVSVARLSDPDALDSPLAVNDQSSDHITYQISYSVQRTADGTSSAIVLKGSPQIATVVQAFIAKAELMKSTNSPSVAAPVEQPVSNQPEPNSLPTQPAGNSSDNNTPDASSPAPSGSPDETSGPDSHPNANPIQNQPE